MGETRTTQRLAQMFVTYDDIIAILRLPLGVSIKAIVVQDAADLASERFAILIEGPQCHAHAPGSHPPVVGACRDALGRTYLAL